MWLVNIRSKVKFESPLSSVAERRALQRRSTLLFQEISLQRPKTGEEGAYEMDEHGEIGEGDLGISDEEEINR